MSAIRHFFVCWGTKYLGFGRGRLDQRVDQPKENRPKLYTVKKYQFYECDYCGGAYIKGVL